LRVSPHPAQAFQSYLSGNRLSLPGELHDTAYFIQPFGEVVHKTFVLFIYTSSFLSSVVFSWRKTHSGSLLPFGYDIKSLSRRLQPGFCFLRCPLPAYPSVPLTVHLPLLAGIRAYRVPSN